MKKHLILALGLALLGTLTPEQKAHAYSSATGVDPDYSNVGNGEAPSLLSHDVETKAVKKSATAGKSKALVSGLVVQYSTEADGYTVTRAVTSGLGQNQLACVTTDEVATGDTGYHRCITKGFSRVRYNVVDATRAIVAGRAACVNADGIVQGCAFSGPDAVEATANTGIIPLESKSSGSGTDLKVILNLR